MFGIKYDICDVYTADTFFYIVIAVVVCAVSVLMGITN